MISQKVQEMIDRMGRVANRHESMVCVSQVLHRGHPLLSIGV
jgi:hypothetical protein